MAGQSAGKCLWLAVITLTLACVPPISPDDSLNPKSLFSVGSSFLENSSTAAIKGRIEFNTNNSIQNGSFILYLNGPDSLSFLIEGPFSADVFRMVIIDTTANILGNRDEGWRKFRRGEDIDIPDYGLENLSPFLIGLFVFPQYYIHPKSSADIIPENNFIFKGETLKTLWNDNIKEFSLLDDNSKIMAAYSIKKSFANGYYPSKIAIAGADNSWKITLQITKVVLNREIPLKTWLIE